MSKQLSSLYVTTVDIVSVSLGQALSLLIKLWKLFPKAPFSVSLFTSEQFHPKPADRPDPAAALHYVYNRLLGMPRDTFCSFLSYLRELICSQGQSGTEPETRSLCWTGPFYRSSGTVSITGAHQTLGPCFFLCSKEGGLICLKTEHWFYELLAGVSTSAVHWDVWPVSLRGWACQHPLLIKTIEG